MILALQFKGEHLAVFGLTGEVTYAEAICCAPHSQEVIESQSDA